MQRTLSSYTFDASSGEITLTGLNIPQAGIVSITSGNFVLYGLALGQGNATYSQGTNSVITVPNVFGLSNSAVLNIEYDDAFLPSYSSNGALESGGNLDAILAKLNSGVSIIGSGSGNDLAFQTYYVTTAFTGANVGDTISCMQVISPTATPSVVSTLWYNQTQATALASAPTASNLSLVGENTLTASQLASANLAKETGGNLAAINTAAGAQADAAWVSGSGSIISILKAIVGKLAGALTTTDSGTKITAATIPSGGIGLTGWISAVFNYLSTGVFTVIDAFQTPVVQTWNSSTSVNSAVSVNTAGYDGVGLTLVGSGTITGGAVIYEYYDGAAWLPMKIARQNAYSADSTYSLSLLNAGGTQGYTCDIAPYTQLRARLTSAIVGSGSVLVTLVSSSAPVVGPLTVGIDPSTTEGSNSDGVAVLTTGVLPVAAKLEGYNGTGWDRLRSGITGVVSSILGFLNTAPFGTYNSTSPTLTNGQSANLQLSASGALLVDSGTDATGVTQLTGGVGIRGWLSGIYSKLSGSIAVTNAGTFAVQNTQADGNDSTQGAKADTTATGTTITTGAWSVIALLKGIYNALNAALPTGTNSIGAITTLQLAATLGAKTTANSPAFNVASDQLQPYGAATTANCPAVNIASDQAAIPVSAKLIAPATPPASQSIAATGTVGPFSVQGGSTVALTLTNAPAATATWVGTVGFQWSPDGSTWNNLTAIPKTQLPGASAVGATSTIAAGLWLASLPDTAIQVRYNVTAWTSGTIWGFVESFQTPNAVVILPFVPTVTSGQSLVGPLDVSGISEITVQISAATTTQLTFQGSNDPTFTTAVTLNAQDTTLSTSAGTGAAVYTTPQKILTQGFKWFRAQCTTTGTVLTVQGVSATLGSRTALTAAGSSLYVTTNNSSFNINQVSGTTAAANTPQGASNKALGVIVSGATNSTLTTTAFAGNGATNGATQAITDGGMASAAFDINVTALTLGTATSVLFSIEESYDNGTTFSTIWTSQPVTATGHVRVPALNISGRIRLRSWSVGGTSTTVTTATNIMESGISVLKQMQHCDVYAATNPMTTDINGTAFASTLVSTTASSASSACLVEGMKVLTISGVFTGGTPTVAPVYTLQISQDGTNWFSTTTTMSPTAAGTFAATTSGNVCARYARLIVSTASTGGTPYGVTYTAINGTN